MLDENQPDGKIIPLGNDQLNRLNEQFVKTICEQLSQRRIRFELTYIKPITDEEAKIEITSNFQEPHKKICWPYVRSFYKQNKNQQHQG